MSKIDFKAFGVDAQFIAVVAMGNAPTAGYKHYLENYSDGLRFIAVPPSGPAAEVITPFFTFGFISVEGDSGPRSVNVYDESGALIENVPVTNNVNLTKLLGDTVGNG